MGQICSCTPNPKDSKSQKLLQDSARAETKGQLASERSEAKMPLPSINPTCLTKYAKAVLKCDLSNLTKNQQQALLKLRQASTLMDEIFLLQCTGKSLRYLSVYKYNE